MNETHESPLDPALAEHLDILHDLAREIGADGVFILRGVEAATLTYVPEDPSVEFKPALQLHITPGHPTLFLAVFAARDEREPGVES